MNIEFLSTVALIAPDPRASRKLYVDALGLPLESQGGDYQPQRAARRLPVFRHLADRAGRRSVLRDVALAGGAAGAAGQHRVRRPGRRGGGSGGTGARASSPRSSCACCAASRIPNGYSKVRRAVRLASIAARRSPRSRAPLLRSTSGPARVWATVRDASVTRAAAWQSPKVDDAGSPVTLAASWRGYGRSAHA